MEPLKVAVVGCGRMGAEPSSRLEGIVPPGWLPISHAEAVAQSHGLELAALCDVDDERLRLRGQQHGVATLFTDYRRLLEEVRPDIVAVATRTPEKADIIRAACEHGVRGLYVEKPIAGSIRQAQDLLSSTEAAGVKVAYGVNRRYHDVYRRARRVLRDGAIGEVLDIVLEHGKAPLLWSHPHSVDLALFLSGEQECDSVQASCVPDSVRLSSEGTVLSDPVLEHAFIKFRGGCVASIVRSGGCTVRVGGSAGTLTVHGDGGAIQVSRGLRFDSPYFTEHSWEYASSEKSATVTAFEELGKAIRYGGDPPIRPVEILLGVKLLSACAWSHINGSAPVLMSDVPEDLVVLGMYNGVPA